MAEPQSIQVDKGGSLGQPRTQSPKTIHAWARARATFMRTHYAGIVLLVLTAAFVAALFMRIDGAFSILSVVGTAMGILLGGRDRNEPDNS